MAHASKWFRGLGLGLMMGLVSAGAGLGCGAATTGPTMNPGRPLPGLNLTGKWYSSEFGDMEITQNKNQVTGRYADPRGPDHNGRIHGRINNDLLEIEWVKAGNPVAAVMPMRGHARLRILDNGCKIDGLWGYNKDWHGGGNWRAEKSQFAAGGEHCGEGAVKKPAAPIDFNIDDGTTEEQLRDLESAQ